MPKFMGQTIGTIPGLDWGNAGSVAGAMLIAIGHGGAGQLLRQTHETYHAEQHDGTSIATNIDDSTAIAVLGALQRLHADLVENSVDLLPDDTKLLYDNLWELYE